MLVEREHVKKSKRKKSWFVQEVKKETAEGEKVGSTELKGKERIRRKRRSRSFWKTGKQAVTLSMMQKSSMTEQWKALPIPRSEDDDAAGVGRGM